MSQDSHFRDQASRHEATEESPLLIDTAYRSERSSVYGGESAQLINSPWKVQVAILLLLYLAEPITATVIYPFLPHVSFRLVQKYICPLNHTIFVLAHQRVQHRQGQ